MRYITVLLLSTFGTLVYSQALDEFRIEDLSDVEYSHDAPTSPTVEPSQTSDVNHLTLTQWVRASDDGSISGRVVTPLDRGQFKALSDVAVAILRRDGQVLRTSADAKGEFRFSGVGTGVYALTAVGDKVFACCALHVIAATEHGEIELPGMAEVSVGKVDSETVQHAIARYLPRRRSALAGALEDASLADAQLESLAVRLVGEKVFRVARVGGGMIGRLHLAGVEGASLRDAASTNVFILKDGREVARTMTDSEGRFEVSALAGGQYTLLAAGAGGAGLVGFELVGATSEESESNGSDLDERLIGHELHEGCCEEFAMQLAPMPEVVTCVEEVVEPTECDLCEGGEILEGEVIMDGFGSPLAGGGYATGGGPGSGGGGGGGGGFGGGGLGGLAALAAIGAAAAGSGGGGGGAIVAPGPASPVTP